MKSHRLVLAALVFTAASPAFATGGLRCEPVNRRAGGPVLDMVIGHGVAPQLVSVRLEHGGRTFHTGGAIGTSRAQPIIVAQSWIDERELRLDLVDAQAMRFEGRLRARFQSRLRGRPATGTFVRGGRTYPMRCVEA